MFRQFELHSPVPGDCYAYTVTITFLTLTSVEPYGLASGIIILKRLLLWHHKEDVKSFWAGP